MLPYRAFHRKQDRIYKARELIKSFEYPTIVAYTDGGSNPNPGFAGCGVSIEMPACFTNDKDHSEGEGEGEGEERIIKIERSLPLSGGSRTNNIAELTAVGLALKLICDQKDQILRANVAQKCRGIQVITDSNYVRGLLILGHTAHCNEELVERVRGILASTVRMFHPISVRVHWVPAHCGIEGNERADELATIAVQIAEKQ